MLNLPPLGMMDEPTAPTVATSEFLAQQMIRRQAEVAENSSCIIDAEDLSAEELRHASEAMTPMEHPASLLPADLSARTETAPAHAKPDDANARTENWQPSGAEQGTSAAPESTVDDAARTRLDDGVDTIVTAQQARSIGITPPTTAKLSAFLQWVLDHRAAAETRWADTPNDAHETELRDFRALAVTTLDIINGRMPLWALGRYTNPLYGTTEQLFTEEEVEQAQPHFRSQVVVPALEVTKASLFTVIPLLGFSKCRCLQ